MHWISQAQKRPAACCVLESPNGCTRQSFKTLIGKSPIRVWHDQPPRQKNNNGELLKTRLLTYEIKLRPDYFLGNMFRRPQAMHAPKDNYVCPNKQN